MNRLIVVSAIIYGGFNSILCSRHKAQKLLYCPPGGKVEGDETLIQALIRETKEEIGVTIQTSDITYIGYKEPSDALVHFFQVRNVDGDEIKNMEPHKCTDWEFISVLDNYDEMVPGLKLLFYDYVCAKPHVAFPFR